MSIRGKRYPLFLLAIPVLLILTVAIWVSFTGAQGNDPDGSVKVLTEMDFADDPELFALPDEEIVAVFLESPFSTGEPNDTGEKGIDVIPFIYDTDFEHTFCWDDDDSSSEHYMTLVDSEGASVITVIAGGDCITETIAEGDYEMHVIHDGKSDRRVAVFIVPQDDKSIVTTASDETLLNVASVLNSDKCQGCDLSDVNLNGADLSNVDLSDAILNNAILVDANLSGADLSSAQLVNADLSRANLRGADLSGANLTNAILISADLTDANLSDANLENADTTGANFSGALTTGTFAAGTKAISGEENQAEATVSTRATIECSGGDLPAGNAANPEDLEVKQGECIVQAGTYNYRNVNIYDGGTLKFMDADIDFWAKSILVEKDASLIAGTQSTPIGNNGTLTIYLYGSKDDKAGIECKTDPTTCGIDVTINPMNQVNPSSCQPSTMPDGTTDCFYEYMAPDALSGETGFFGSKVLAVSFGGTLQMYGAKGATINDGSLPKSSSGTSWVRLASNLTTNSDTLTVNRPVPDWKEKDHIVVTTTDYLPGHSEKLVITKKLSDTEFEYDVLDPHTNEVISDKVMYPHNGTTYPLDKVPDRLKLDIKVDGQPAVETRAAVGLLTRSIRIVSAGNSIGQMFGAPTPGNHFGGHMMVRQGVKSLEVQGVEFYQLGQGGRKGRYPAHLHLLRKSPGTFIKDSSIHDSMTRWITLHGTQEVTLARNVGFMSIGHGYYLEDGTEINNELYSNLGVLARAAVFNSPNPDPKRPNGLNPREVPGILAASTDPSNINVLTSVSDYIHPTVFWFTNMWNDIEYNMAAGATGCGACYWPVNAAVSGPSKYQKWESYASIKPLPGRDATAPIKKFNGNYCTTAMNSYNATVSTTPCVGVAQGGSVQIKQVPNPLAPPLPPPCTPDNKPNLTLDACTQNEFYYPIFSANPNATRCEGAECGGVAACSGTNVDNCAVTVLDRYTTSFHWAETNFSAIWLRRAFFTVINSAITDVQNAGLTFVTGGDYTQSSLLPGSFMLAANNVFIGNTQKGNPYSSNAGPFSKGGLSCKNPISDNNYCLDIDEAISMPLSNFAMNQRLFNIYDGPANQSSNAYLDIKKTSIDDCTPAKNGVCSGSDWMQGRVLGVPRDVEEVIDGNEVKRVVKDDCILPNAAIAWKQPNGFYYPPAFHSDNLFFSDVDIRHFVLEPLFLQGSFDTDFEAVKLNYCVYNSASFAGWTAIDRQTILNDDDGSLTGVERTISVNEDPFFRAPIEQFECRSEASAKTSPYEYVTTVVYPGCGLTCNQAEWSANCTSGCYGVPLIRQLLTGSEDVNSNTEIRMMGPAIAGRINLTANKATYYVDTTRNQAQSSFPLKNIFKADQTYYTFFVFAKPEIKQTYQFYVGKTDTIDAENPQIVNAVRANIATKDVTFNQDGLPPLAWDDTGWDRKYDSSTGILTVTVDMENFRQNFDDAREEGCKPSSFCTFENNKCGCSKKILNDPDNPNKDLYEDCQRVDICRWAGNDPDCPVFKVGDKKVPLCLGFGITMPGSFVADDAPDHHRPQPTPFPRADWDVPWPKVGSTLAGQECFDFPTPPTNFADGDNTTASTSRNIIEGTEGDDVLSGTMGPDLILGFGGDDEIEGRGGDDIIEGGPGNDVIRGNRGDDDLIGGEGDDLILGGKGDDDIEGGSGNDDIKGGRGSDDIFGGSGDDDIRGSNGNDDIDGGQGFDEIDGGEGNDSCVEGEDDRDCEEL